MLQAASLFCETALLQPVLMSAFEIFPQLEKLRRLIDVNVMLDRSCVGKSRCVLLPSPMLPFEFCPQQNTRLAAVRPHAALNHQPPSSRFRLSPRALPTSLPHLEQPSAAIVRRVWHPGRVSYAARQFLIGRAFVGEDIGLIAEDDQELSVWLGPHRIGRLDLTEARPTLHAR